MSKDTSAELCLINDSEFLEELAQLQSAPRRDQGFAALESGLPAAESDMSVGEFFNESYGPAPAAPATNPYDQPIEASPSVPARQIPMLTAALVLAACLSAGAATAAFLFQDELPRLSALLPAIR